MESMTVLLNKYNKAREQVSDTHASTIATAKNFLQVAEHRRFVVFENDTACLQDMVMLLVEEYGKQVFGLHSNIARN